MCIAVLWTKHANATAKFEDGLNDANRRITEMEKNQTRLEIELAQTKQNLSLTNESLHNATTRIIQLEIKLSNVTDRTSMIESNLSQLTTEQIQIRNDLNGTTLRTTVVETELVDIKIEVLFLNDTKASKVVVDEITDRVEDLETGKVDKTEFEVLSDNVTSLREDTSQADEDIREDLNDLGNNTLQHYHQLQDDIDKLKHSKANQSNFEELVVHVNDLANSTVQTSDFLQSNLNLLTEQITNLTVTTVDRVEFDSLSINVTILRESSAREDEILHEEIEALVNGSLNLTQHNQLKDLIEEFALTKANQTDLEELENSTTTKITELDVKLLSTETEIASLNDTKASKVAMNEISDRVEDLETEKVDKTEFEILSDNVTSLRDQTTDFLQAIHVINNTSMEIQGDIVELNTHLTLLEDGLTNTTHRTAVVEAELLNTQENMVKLGMNFTTLTHNIHHINITLARKADQNAVESLTLKLDSLSDTTVRTTTFETAIQTLTTDKADQSDLVSVQEKVNLLDNDITANSDKLNTLETRVTQHITSSDKTHKQLSSDITSNGILIESNTDRIEHVEDELEQHIDDSSQGLKQFWTMPFALLAMLIIHIIY